MYSRVQSQRRLVGKLGSASGSLPELLTASIPLRKTAGRYYLRGFSGPVHIRLLQPEEIRAFGVVHG